MTRKQWLCPLSYPQWNGAAFSNGVVPHPRTGGRRQSHGMPALALTDHGNMCTGWWIFTRPPGSGIKPILVAKYA